ncbi:cytochrome P450 [Xylariales sp. PMI_506]|nr:cytochrome P450 [Xylariales sp. PMI_506]
MGLLGTILAIVRSSSSRSIVAFAAAAAATSLLVVEFRSWHRLRHIPGPFLASLSSIWMVRKSLSGRLHEHLKEAADTYGPLVRIGPNEVLSTDPEVLHMMSAARSPYTKGVFYETGRIIPGQDTVVSLRDPQEHKALRAKMSAAFNGRENEGFGFGAGIDRQLSALTSLIGSKYISTTSDYRPVQFFQKISFFTLDVIGDISFGNAFGFLAQDQDLYSYHEIHDQALPIMNVMAAMPWLSHIVQRWPFSLALPREGDKFGFGRLMGYVPRQNWCSTAALFSFATSLIEERLEPEALPQKDMTQAFINSGMTRSELVQQVFVQIVAGSVSSATAICLTLLCLITTPASYATLRKEIDEAIEGGTISSPISDAEAKKLPYLQAVIREGLRMYPPVTGLGSKQVPKGGDCLNGYFVPEGTQVGTNFFGVTRSKAIFGEDADVFRPERWLESTGDHLKSMNAAVDLEFGYGMYQCLGKPIAMMELNKIFVELLRRYDFMIINAESPITIWSAIFWVGHDFWLRIEERKPLKQ